MTHLTTSILSVIPAASASPPVAAPVSGLADLWLDAIGHLHPVLVHFPLALAIAAFVVELSSRLRRRAAPSQTALTMIWIAAACAPLAAASGWWNAAFGGESGDTLELHRWFGLASMPLLVAVAVLGTLARPERAVKTRRAYRLGLFVTAGALGFVGHLGGTMTWGEGYTTKLFVQAARATITGRVPEETAPRVPAPRPVPAGQDSFAEQAMQIFATHCSDCHLDGKHKGSLDLRTREGVVRVDGSGLWIIQAGRPDGSELMRRVRLGAEDEERMPPKGERLTPAEIEVLRAWIAAGAPWPDQ